ncbi:MAG: hypothetical protein COA45_08240 [Zetaproteobacteria bacterium]|nr:MAG: hypothetical protein COA45_08240 [Zetaproteobacteria bacterium]
MSKQADLLQKQDPAPVKITKRKGVFIFSGPHNGCAVPTCFEPCMGTNKDWFNKAHEAMDLHMAALFSALEKSCENVTLIAGNYSRLVCDLNALPDYAITRHSPENVQITIPQNQPDICCKDQHARRLDAVFWPYHNAKTTTINEKREQYGGAIVLDLHSFSPTWEQKKRNVELGTLRCEKTPFSRAFENHLREQSEYLFVSGEPYRVAERKQNAAPMITANNDLQYLGLEIRHDLIATQTGIDKMVIFLKKCVEHMEQHPDRATIIKPRSSVMPPDTKEPELQQSWSI